MRLFSRLPGGTKTPEVPVIRDSVLGTLRWFDDRAWEATVTLDGQSIRFEIGGESEPAAPLLAHARGIVEHFPAFRQTIATFLETDGAGMQLTPDQVRELKIDTIMLCWPDRPDDGMIFFSGLEEIGCWRCDYVHRQPRSLGFDT